MPDCKQGKASVLFTNIIKYGIIAITVYYHSGVCECQIDSIYVPDCQAGTYGINCADSCSQYCRLPDQCDRVTGSCSGDCHQWYGLDTCMAEISKYIVLYLKNGISQ